MQYAQSYLLKAMTDGEGKFKLAGLPGRAAGRRDDGPLAPRRREHGVPPGLHPGRADVPPGVAEFDIPKGAKTFAKEIRLDPGRVVEGTLIDAEGKPSRGPRLRPDNLGYWERAAGGSTFKAVSLVPAPGLRALVSVTTGGSSPGGSRSAATRRIGPGSAWSPGRRRRAGSSIPRGSPAGNGPESLRRQAAPGGGTIDHEPEPIRTDADGRFRVEGMAPGLAYQMYVQAVGGMRAEKPFEIPAMKPGECPRPGDCPRRVSGSGLSRS